MLIRRLTTALGGLLLGVIHCGSDVRAQPPALLPNGEHGPFDAVFAAAPPRAIPAAGSACEVADRWIGLIAAGQASGAAALFAADGLLLGPSDRPLHGSQQISAFHQGLGQPDLIPLSFIDKDAECLVEIAMRPSSGPPGAYRLAALGHFTVDADRKIEKLVIYGRPALAGSAGFAP